MDKELTLEDLVDLSGLPLRTLRFYIQEGILQGPDTHGKNARYSQQHIDRLELIQRLKNLRLPLQEIRHLLNNMIPVEISQIRQYQDVLNQNLSEAKNETSERSPISKPGSSALEYIRNLEVGRENIRSIVGSPARIPSAPQQKSSSPPVPSSFQYQNKSIALQETLKRIFISDGIELTVREPQNVDEEIKVKKLIEFAQKLFGNQS